MKACMCIVTLRCDCSKLLVLIEILHICNKCYWNGHFFCVQAEHLDLVLLLGILNMFEQLELNQSNLLKGIANKTVRI